jgi:neutral ceramidase
MYSTVEAAMVFNEAKANALVAYAASGCSDIELGQENVLTQGTHTHSAAGGFTSFAMYDVTTAGYRPQTMNALVDALVTSWCRAAADVGTQAPGSAVLSVATTEVLNASISRSAYAYDANPAEERALYKYNTDKNMTQLTISRGSDSGFLVMNWFATHGTSFNNTNRLLSSDNKGYASYVLEEYGHNVTMALFSNANEGDVSPNVLGAFCGNPATGAKPCESVHSTCDGKAEGCTSWGPGRNMYESAVIVGQRQADAAVGLLSTFDKKKIPSSTYGLRYIHQFVDFGAGYDVSEDFTTTGSAGRTCSGALGDATAAGTTDGPGAFDFRQGTNSTSDNPFWNFIAHMLHRPNATQVACQHPKPILLDTQNMPIPGPWTASVMPVQLVSYAPSLVIIGVPGEFTTMAGRRLRATVRRALAESGWPEPNPTLVIAGLANEYSHYITTFEEYGVQRYEGGSTIFGPHSLAAYQQVFDSLARALAAGTPVSPGPTPVNLTGTLPSFETPVIFDTVPLGWSFGDVLHDVPLKVAAGHNVSATFYGANLRNNLMTDSSFLTVRRRSDNATMRTDNDWDTFITWKRKGISESLVTVTWTVPTKGSLIPARPTDGTICGESFYLDHAGYQKPPFRSPRPYFGSSSPFTVTCDDYEQPPMLHLELL